LCDLLAKYIQELDEYDEADALPTSIGDKRLLALLNKRLLSSRYRLEIDEALLQLDRALHPGDTLA
jgi:hypothetical protein